MLKLSVIIVNYNVRYFLELCLESVQVALTGIDSEVIVIDNNSTDDSCEMVKALFPDVILIQNAKNVGFSKANNQGVDLSKGEYVCILNPDTIVAEDSFTKILTFATNKDNLGIVGCKLIDGTGCFLPESKRNLPVVKVAIQKMRGNATYYYANDIKEDEIAKVDVLVGAFMFMKRAVYQDLEGFDEDYFMYGEDIDLSYKAQKRGLDNYYYGATTIIHFKGESTMKDALYAKRFYGAMQIFYKKHFRSNWIFDVFVWIGIKLAFLMRKEPRFDKPIISNWVVFTEKNLELLRTKLDHNIIRVTSIDEIENQCVVVFDVLETKFKTIIENLEALSKNQSIYYRILSTRSSFLLGSDSASHRGEIVKW